MNVGTTNFYDKKFLKASQKQQELFLRTLFAQDKIWCERFLSFTESITTLGEINMDEWIKKMNQSIATIDVEDFSRAEDYNSYSCRNYFDDYETMYDYDALNDDC